MATLPPVRFHVRHGPASLFERVRFVFREPRQLALHGGHLRERADRRSIPVEALEVFDPSQWELMTVEVREDTGKFVTTAWRGVIGGESWWVVIGYHDTVQTAYRSGKVGDGPDIVRGGAFYDFVESVNRVLMERSRSDEPSQRPSVHDEGSSHEGASL